MPKKEAQYLMIKGGEKVFFDKVVSEDDKKIVIEKIALSGRVSRTEIRQDQIVGKTTWEATA